MLKTKLIRCSLSHADVTNGRNLIWDTFHERCRTIVATPPWILEYHRDVYSKCGRHCIHTCINFYSLLRSFIAQLLLHGHSFESLHAEISPMALPEEYGGQRPPLDPEECWKPVEADKDYFASCCRYGYATSHEDEIPSEPEPLLELTCL